MKIWTYLEMAGDAAQREQNDLRCHTHGAVGIRADGAIVSSRNGFSRFKIPCAHAEARLLRKLDKKAIVFVARVRKNGEFAMSMPCSSCLLGLMMKRVRQVYYTTDTEGVYGCIDLERIRK